ncbi:MAG: 50S ribosomal protein L4 [Candidatus Levybacteria bacterium]|nr:50S ribosomal protein L4 [Candidatus Levybacteria bacterium]
MPTKKNSKLSPRGEAGKAQNSKPQLKTKKITKKVIKVKKAPLKISKLENKIPVSKSTKVGSLTASVFDTKGKVAGSVNLPTEIFGAKVNNPLMSQAVRVYLANQRLGTVKTKDRGEVHGSTRKIWQQKGTGRARHGSRKAPLFVHGGIAFGPKPKDPSLNLSKKMKTKALFSALSSKLKDKEIKIVKGLETIAPKTKIMCEILKNLEVSDKKILLVMPKLKELKNIYRASRNIEGVEILSANTLNAYRVLDNKLILLMKDAIDTIKNTFIKKE